MIGCRTRRRADARQADWEGGDVDQAELERADIGRVGGCDATESERVETVRRILHERMWNESDHH
jgi:hypothetical protein